jgi:membrane fusion protein (multidrug efflux system)
MNPTPNLKTRLLRTVWSLIPWLLVAALAAFVMVVIGRIGEKKAQLAEAKKAAMKKEERAVRVIALSVSPARLVDQISLPAEVEPFEDLWVKAEVRGQVVQVSVEEGDDVQKDEVLIQLDDRDYRARLARIQANFRQAVQEYKRHSVLAEKQLTAKAKLEELQARVKDLDAQLKEAGLALDRCAIRAPISGRVNDIAAKKGNFLSIGDPAAQILQFDQVKVTVGVPESDVAAVFDLDKAEVVIDALEGLRVEGKKIFLARKPKSLARLYDLELAVPNPDGRILPGMFARVVLVKQVYNHSVAVPLYAVITEGAEQFVYVAHEGRAHKRNVELGILVGWQVQITSGLGPGESVIVVGHRFLSDGQPVEVIKTVHDPQEILQS